MVNKNDFNAKQFLKVQRTKHVSVVRKCKGLHVHCFCFCYKGVDF